MVICSNHENPANANIHWMTTKEWRKENLKLAEKRNVRDCADLLHLVILYNLENTNAEFIKLGIS